MFEVERGRRDERVDVVSDGSVVLFTEKRNTNGIKKGRIRDVGIVRVDEVGVSELVLMVVVIMVSVMLFCFVWSGRRQEGKRWKTSSGVSSSCGGNGSPESRRKSKGRRKI